MRSGSTRMYEGILLADWTKSHRGFPTLEAALLATFSLCPVFLSECRKKKASRIAAHCLELIRRPQGGLYR